MRSNIIIAIAFLVISIHAAPPPRYTGTPTIDQEYIDGDLYAVDPEQTPLPSTVLMAIASASEY
jgi:hypothetical protein